MVWTVVEIGLAITAASLITTRPLLRALKFRGFGASEITTYGANSTHNTNQSMGQRSGQDMDLYHMGNWRAISSISGGDGKISQNVRGRLEGPAASEEYILQGMPAEEKDIQGIKRTRTVIVAIDPKSVGRF